MLKKLGEKVLWKRVDDFLATYQPFLIGITGSTGKSITRDAIACALGDDRRVRTSTHSFHTPLDVALSILDIDELSSQSPWYKLLSRSLIQELKVEEPDTIVVELGADRPGHIDFLSQRLPFNVGIVTNVGTTHTAYFVSKDMVAHEKKSLIVSLPRDGVAILNADDPLVAAMAEGTQAKVIFVGYSPEAHVQLVRAERLKDGGFALEVKVHNHIYELHLMHIIARHYISKILIALAVADVLQLDLEKVCLRLQKFTPPFGRMRLLPGMRGSRIIDDSYTASPESVVAALLTLRALPAARRIAILGDMTDLGGVSHHAHAAIGETAAQSAQVVIVVGEEMRQAGKSALKAGADVHQFDAAGEVGKWLADFIHPGDVILVTGSRPMQMEEVVERLLADTAKIKKS